MLQQLQAKYGNPNIPGVNEFIKSAVRDFVGSFDNILSAEAMVGSLLKVQKTNILYSAEHFFRIGRRLREHCSKWHREAQRQPKE